MNKKRYQKTFMITCLLTLLPILVGLLLYNRLPARMAIHFGLNDSPNGFATKAWAICAIPILMLLSKVRPAAVWKEPTAKLSRSNAQPMAIAIVSFLVARIKLEEPKAAVKKRASSS